MRESFPAHRVLAVTTFLAVAGASLVLGCTPAITGIFYASSDHGPSPSQKVLLEEELAPYRDRGESAITGRVFLETPDGEVAGVERPVHLTPATEYAKALAQAEVVEKNEMIDRKAEDVWWTTRADRAGRFVFSFLPAGDYLVLSPVAWSPGHDTSAEEAIAYALVRVRERQQIDVEVTRRVGF